MSYALLAPAVALAQPVCTPSAQNPSVRFTTSLGAIDVRLCRADAPVTVDNFLQYVDDGAYTDSGFVHRSVKSGIFVAQGGGAWVDDNGVMHMVETLDPIPLEVHADLQHVRGTIAMARTSVLASATSQWFFNVQANPSLDPTFDSATPPNATGGYAVFGEVTAGLSVLDAIAAQTIWNISPGFLSEVPLISYPDDGSSQLPYLVYVSDIERLPEPGAGVAALAALATLAGLARARRRRTPS